MFIPWGKRPIHNKYCHSIFPIFRPPGLLQGERIIFEQDEGVVVQHYHSFSLKGARRPKYLKNRVTEFVIYYLHTYNILNTFFRQRNRQLKLV